MIRIILRVVGVVLLFLYICVTQAEGRDLPEVRSGALKMLGISILCLWWGFRMFSRTGMILTVIVHLFAAGSKRRKRTIVSTVF